MEKLTKRNIQPFNGEKYSVWKFRIRALLAELDVLKIIDNDVPEMETDEWRKKNLVARNVIVDYLSDSFLGFAKDNEQAQDIFAKLDNIYERRSLATQLALRKQLLTLKLKGDDTLFHHFTYFDSIMADLVAAGAVLDEMDKVSHLLLTLPSPYDGVITALETLCAEDLNLSYVKTRLLDHEVKIQTENDTTSLKVLNAQKFKPYKPLSGSTEKFTEKFKQKGGRKFFKKNKYSQKSKKDKYKMSKTTCDHCGRHNHIKSDCYFYKRMIASQTTEQSANVANSNHFAFMLGNKTNHKEEDGSINFLLDSGATDHIINREDVFTSWTTLSPPLRIAVAKTGEALTALKKGTIEVTTNLGFQGTLQNVLFTPDAVSNLLSVKRIQESGMKVIFDNEGVKVEDDKNKIILSGKSNSGLFSVKFVYKSMANITRSAETSGGSNNNFRLWHERLGHISNEKFKQLKQNELVEDINVLSQITPTTDLCEACIFGKQARLPFNKIKSKSHDIRPLFIIHSDVCGPITPPTINNQSYFVTFIDEYTHYTVLYLLTYKSEVLKVFKDFVNKSEAHFNQKVVNLYCDNGREYLSNEFKDFCLQKGITFHLTVPHTPAQNGVAERMNRTITEKARAMLSSADLNKAFWGEAVLTAMYLINRTPTKALKINKTPYELWHNKKPQINHLKVFGCTAYVLLKTRNNKFDNKSIKSILVGYEPSGYKLWNVETEKFITARDVIVDEINYKVSRPRVTEEKALIKTSEITKHTRNEIPDSINREASKYKNNKQDAEPNDNKHVRRSERLINRSIISYNENDNDEFQNYVITAQTEINSVPQTYCEIKQRVDKQQWELAIKDELDSLLLNKTWSFVTKPLNTNIVSCKWIFTIKTNAQGQLNRYKARLVARGFSQKFNVDYDETFAPVARLSTFRFLLAFAFQNNLLIHHMDVKTAFLNGILTETIYMEIPEGVIAKTNQVCKLNKTLYGLKQASRCWYQKFDSVMKEKGFQNSAVDPCVYFLDKGNISNNIYVLLYVDDLVIITQNLNTMDNFKNYLTKQFQMRDLSDIKLFLGIEIQRSNSKLTLNQTAYLKRILQKFNMSDCKPIKTPLPLKLDYTNLESNEYYDAPCKNLIGCLMYAMLCTRPDLSYAVNILSRYQSKNNKLLWQYLKGILRYIKGSLELKLTYIKGEHDEILIGYADSDWGGCDTDRKSTSGYLFKAFQNCTISWNTRKQNTVAVSSTEAEYIALFESAREAIWFKSFLTSININVAKPILIFEDNNGCICIANNPTNHKKSKHIDIKYHYTREQINKGNITLKYIPTNEQQADILTKTISPFKFMELITKIGLH